VEVVGDGVVGRFRVMLEDRKVLGDEHEEEDVGSDDAYGHQRLDDGRGINQLPRLLHAEHGDVEAVQDQAEHDQAGCPELHLLVGLDPSGEEHPHGEDDTGQHFHQEEGQQYRPVEERTVGEERQGIELDEEVDPHYPGDDLCQGGEELRLVGLPHVAVHQAGLEDDDGKAGEDGREPELQRQQRVVPEVVQLVHGDEKEGPQGGLVQGGDHRRQDGEGELQGPQQAQRQVPAELFRHRVEELQSQDRGVGHDAHGDLEHGGVDVPVAHDVDAPLGLPQVEEQADADQGVAEEAGDDGRPHQRLQLLDMEDVGDDAYGEGAGRQRHGGDHVEGDPQSPGVGVVEVGGHPQAEDEADQGGERPDSGEDHHQFDEVVVPLDFIHDDTCGGGHSLTSLSGSVLAASRSSSSLLIRSLRCWNQETRDRVPPTPRKIPGTKRSACQV